MRASHQKWHSIKLKEDLFIIKEKFKKSLVQITSMILPEYQTSNSASSSKLHHLALLALLVALVLHSSNFHYWPLLASLVTLVLH